MSLNDRKIRILQAIINDYIQTAEPVGSRTIAKKYDFGLSSATIRNEMSDLEEMGFIIQPHASAGRIPSEMGYRLYVDSLMQEQNVEEVESSVLQGVVAKNINQIEFLMEETAKMLSAMTNYTTIVTEPVTTGKKIKKISFMKLDEKNVVIMVASDDNDIKTHITKLDYMPEETELYNIGFIISDILNGQLVENIDEAVINELNEKLPCYPKLISTVMEAIGNIAKTNENGQLHLSGTKNILTFPEFSDIQKAKVLMQTLEEKEILQNLLSNPKAVGSEVQIYIGNETGIKEMQDCSVITTTYKFADNIQGSIAILGPTRMNYAQVVSVLNGMVKNIEDVVKKLNNENNNKS